MDQRIHLLIPMSGQGTRYKKAGYKEPKPLIPVNGTPMIQRLLSVIPTSWPAHFVMAENHRETELPACLQQLRPKGEIQFIPEHTEGPGRAILAGLEGIPDDDAVFVSYCDFGMIWDPVQFEKFVRESDCDSCVVSYKGFHAHYLSPQMYAYSRMQGDQVLEVKEKGSFTEDREQEYASCGIYYFRRAALLKEALQYQYQNDVKLNGEYYTSLTVQALLMLKPDADVRVFEIPYFFQWGTPQDLREFEYWEKTFQSQIRRKKPLEKTSQLLMPMAGLGSRFKDFSNTPKPFLFVEGEKMYRKALRSLPSAEKTAFVTLSAARDLMTDSDKDSAVFLKETPSGQALSVLAGLEGLDGSKDVLVSACDHGVVLNPDLWNRFIACPDCDAAIFTVRDFPGATRSPQSFAYVRTDESSELCKKVLEVGVKRPLSETPSQDALLVGTFWFSSAKLMRQGIEELKDKDIRVNGELYLDSVFELLIQAGKTVREIPLDGYINWGDPRSLSEALYWSEVFRGQRADRRIQFPGLNEFSTEKR